MGEVCKMNHCHLGPRRCLACKHQRYGRAHKTARQRWARTIATGTVDCARCGQRIQPGDPWDLDHLDDGTTRPSHAHCNRAAVKHQRYRLGRGTGF